MRRSYLILIVLVMLSAGIVAGLLLIGCLGGTGLTEDSGEVESAGAGPRVTGSGPREERPWRSGAAISRTESPDDEAFAVKVEQASRQMGPGFRVAVVKPFVVTSNQRAEAFEAICGHTIRWAVEMLNKAFFSRGPEKIITIYLFKDQTSYQKYSRSIFGEQPRTPYGYYSPEHEALVMDIGTGGGTLVHEIVHPLLEADFPSAPSWFDEGLASLYEQCRERDGQIAGMLNWRLPVLQKGLRAGHFVGLEQLLSSSREGFYDDPHGMHYAQARYLCYYLQEQQLLRKFYREFKNNQSADPAGIKTLLKVTGKDTMKELEREWLEFLGPLNFKP